MNPPDAPAVRAALLQGILDAPDEDAPRLVYADWLEEYGDEADRERGEFIRLQCRLACLDYNSPERFDGAVREKDLLCARPEWRDEAPSWLGQGDWDVVLLRGFVGALCLKSADLVQRGDELIGRVPVERVTLNNSEAGHPWQRSALLPQVRTLRLEHLDLDSQGLQALLESGTLDGLRTLGLFRGPWPRAVVPLLAGPCLPHLNYLGLDAAELTPEEVCGLLASPDRQALIGLRLGHNPNGRALVAALAGHEGLGRLRALALEVNALRDEAAALLAANSHLRGLTALDLESNEIGPAGARALAASPWLSNLRWLRLGWNPLGPEGTAALANSPYLANLTVLDLNGCRIGVAGARALADSPHLRSLRQLRLDTNELHDEGVIALAGSPVLQTLQTLDLRFNYIGDVAMIALAESPCVTNLLEISTAGNVIRAAGVEALARSPTLANLRTLELTSSQPGHGALALARSPWFQHLHRLRFGGMSGMSDKARVALRERFGRRVRF